MTSWVLRLCTGGLAAMAVLGHSGCPGHGVLDTKVRLPKGFEVRLENVRYQRFDATGLVAEGNTAHALLSPSSGVTRFELAEAHFRVDASSGGDIEIVSGGGSANLFTGQVMLRNSMRVTDVGGRVLAAPSAAFSPEDNSLAGPGPATLIGPNYTLRADTGFFVDLDEQTVDLLGPVTGFVDPPR